MVQLDRRQQLILILLAVVIFFGAGYRMAQVKERAAGQEKPTLEASGENKTKDLIVHVAGAVSMPGVYQLQAGARVIDAVNRAGPTGEAELDALKLASPLADGQTVFVPFKAELVQAGATLPNNPSGAVSSAAGTGRNLFGPQAGPVSPGAGANTGLVNINTADLSQLDTLPGIGPSLAQRIIEYREINGPFSSVEDIKSVSGIGDKKFEDLKDKISVH